MYKTVRHGENSLQYTILPQTEEVLNNSGLKGKGRDYSPSIHVRRTRRKYKWQLTAFTGLIIILGLLCFTMKILKPMYYDKRWLAMDEEIPKFKYVLPTAMREDNPRKKELTMPPEIISTPNTRYEMSPTTTTLATTTVSAVTIPTTREKSTTPPWLRSALRSWKYSTTIQTIPTEGNEIPIGVKTNSKQNVKEKTDVDNMSIKPWEKDIIIRPTVTPESITLRNAIKYYSRSFLPSERPSVTATLFDDVLITTKGTTAKVSDSTTEQSKLKDLKDAMLSVDDDDDFKESLEVDEVFSLPPLKPDTGIVGSDTDEVTVFRVNGGGGGWYGARWPFVDTSSYYQWTGYSPGDNLLLPLLMAAVSSVLLVLLLALALRRRKRTQSQTAQAGSTLELATDDNTNLLAAENGDDAEE